MCDRKANEATATKGAGRFRQAGKLNETQVRAEPPKLPNNRRKKEQRRRPFLLNRDFKVALEVINAIFQKSYFIKAG